MENKATLEYLGTQWEVPNPSPETKRITQLVMLEEYKGPRTRSVIVHFFYNKDRGIWEGQEVTSCENQ